MDEQEYGLTVPFNKGDLIHGIEVATPKADVQLTAISGHSAKLNLTESIS
jgi:hypothetical protein